MKLDLSQRKAELNAQLVLIRKQLEAIQTLEHGFGALQTVRPPADEKQTVLPDIATPERPKKRGRSLSQAALDHVGFDWTPHATIAAALKAEGFPLKGQALAVSLRRWLERERIDVKGETRNYQYRRKT